MKIKIKIPKLKKKNSLYNYFKDQGLKTLGVEPTNIAQIANAIGIDTIQSFFYKEITDEIKSKKG